MRARTSQLDDDEPRVLRPGRGLTSASGSRSRCPAATTSTTRWRPPPSGSTSGMSPRRHRRGARRGVDLTGDAHAGVRDRDRVSPSSTTPTTPIPTSMRAAIDTLAAMKTRRTARRGPRRHGGTRLAHRARALPDRRACRAAPGSTRLVTVGPRAQADRRWRARSGHVGRRGRRLRDSVEEAHVEALAAGVLAR